MLRIRLGEHSCIPLTEDYNIFPNLQIAELLGIAARCSPAGGKNDVAG